MVLKRESGFNFIQTFSFLASFSFNFSYVDDGSFIIRVESVVLFTLLSFFRGHFLQSCLQFSVRNVDGVRLVGNESQNQIRDVILGPCCSENPAHLLTPVCHPCHLAALGLGLIEKQKQNKTMHKRGEGRQGIFIFPVHLKFDSCCI